MLVNAYEMKKIAQSVSTISKKVEDIIEAAAKDGHLSYFFKWNEITDKEITALKSLGYDVYRNEMDGKIEVSWEY